MKINIVEKKNRETRHSLKNVGNSPLLILSFLLFLPFPSLNLPILPPAVSEQFSKKNH